MRATLRPPSADLPQPSGFGHITERIWLRCFAPSPNPFGNFRYAQPLCEIGLSGGVIFKKKGDIL